VLIPPSSPLIDTQSQWPETEQELARRKRKHACAKPEDCAVEWRRVGDFYWVGVRYDGALRNPNGYPEATVRLAIEQALARKRKDREDSVRRGVEKRRQRRDDQIWQAVKAWRRGALVAAHACRCCGRPLTDPPSIARGIGSECWPQVLGWDRHVAGVLFTEGIDREATLRKAAEIRAGLIARHDLVRERRKAEIIVGLRGHYASEDELQRWAGVWAEEDCEGWLQALDRIEDELGRGRLGANSLHQLDEINAAVGSSERGA
jgi:hypothetical protein